jgi:hypothetical protein
MSFQPVILQGMWGIRGPLWGSGIESYLLGHGGWGFSVRSSSRKKGRLSDFTDADMRIWFMDFIPGRRKIKGGCMTRLKRAPGINSK